MRKIFFSIVAIFISLLLVSTGTAVPQTFSEPVIDALEEIDRQNVQYQNIISSISSKNLPLDGIFDLIKQIIQWIIQLVLNLIDIVKQLILLGEIVFFFLKLVELLFSLIQRIIELILNIITPDAIKF